MRCFLLLLLLLISAHESLARTRDSVQLWDGTDADVSWVNENTLPPKSRLKVRLPWLSLSASGGHRLFADDDRIMLRDANQNIMNEGRFLDLIEPGNAFELRSFLHLARFLSLGVIYHLDAARLKVNNQSVAIDPQELSGSVQMGPRLGPVRIYGFYNHIILSRSRDRVSAPTLASAANSRQTFDVEVQQSGGEAGLGTQVRFGVLGIFAEAMQSVHRTFELDIKGGDALFHTTATPSFKAWQLGLSFDF